MSRWPRTSEQNVRREDARPNRDGGKPARLLGRAIFSCALLLIVLAAIPYGSVEFWWASFFELGVFAVTALWAVEALVGGGFRERRWLWLLIPAGCLTLFSLLQTIPLGRGAGGGIENSLPYAVSADPFETYHFALKLAALSLLGALLLRFTTSRARLHALVLTIVGVGAASAVFGILRQSMQHADVGFVLPALPRGVGYAQIISRNQFAFMMEMALGAALGMVFRRGGRYEASLVHLAPALPIGAALILANSRGGILTMMCQLLLLALLVVPAPAPAAHEVGGEGDARPARRRRLLVSLAARVVLVASLLVLAAVAVVHVGGERVVSNLSTVSEELGPGDAATRWNTRRVDIWRATWEMIKDHPLAGVGFGGYWTAITEYHDASGAYTPQQAHNDYLEILASGGVIGCAIFLWLAVVVLRRARQVFLHGDSFRRAACLGALVGLFGVAVHSLFDFGLHLTINSALFVVLLVIATADTTDEHST
ncbi:MAG TPA: O-antigen ligase family protein [Pyrinomonadaceae bacterium]|jgi:O-antigen ligase